MKELSGSRWNSDRMKFRVCKIITVVLVLCLLPQQIRGAVLWTGCDYFNENDLQIWGVTADEITKVTNPGRVYSFSDLSNYSAYISDMPSYIGNKIENSFHWCNRSRLGYIKLFKVKGGSNVSFLLGENFYVYCAEFDSNFIMLDDGLWRTTGDRYPIKEDTAWILIVFRSDNGDLSIGAGSDTEICSADILTGGYEYIIFEPFTYSFNLNGGTYMGSSKSFTMERLGVEPVILPMPERYGYKFGGWRNADGTIYSGKLDTTYDSQIFKDTSFTAVWWPVKAESISLNREYVILEQNNGETVQLTADIMPENTLNKSITWKSDNEEVATVDENGLVTALNTGIATITATTENGVQAECDIYVMGFEVSVPSYCNLYDAYEIDVKVYNNGTEGMSDRKRIILDADSEIELIRIGDESTTCHVLAESSTKYGEGYSSLSGEYVVDTVDSETVYYRLVPSEDIKKSGDYEGNITFTVSVR